MGHVQSAFGIVLPGTFVIPLRCTFVILFLVLLEYFGGIFGVLLSYF